MSKMIDMGYKHPKMGEAAIPEKMDKNKICYPSFSIYDNLPKELFKANVGDTITVKMECKVTRKSLNKDGSKERRDMGFDILKMGIEGNSPKAEEELGDEIMRQSGVEDKK